MPVRDLRMGKGPLNIGRRKAARRSWVFVNVTIVIVVYELVTKCLGKDSPDNSDQEKADTDRDQPLPIRRIARDFFAVFPFVHAPLLLFWVSLAEVRLEV